MFLDWPSTQPNLTLPPRWQFDDQKISTEMPALPNSTNIQAYNQDYPKYGRNIANLDIPRFIPEAICDGDNYLI